MGLEHYYGVPDWLKRRLSDSPNLFIMALFFVMSSSNDRKTQNLKLKTNYQNVNIKISSLTEEHILISKSRQLTWKKNKQTKHGSEYGKLKNLREGIKKQKNKTQTLVKPAVWPQRLTGKTRNHADGEALIIVKEEVLFKIVWRH